MLGEEEIAQANVHALAPRQAGARDVHRVREAREEGGAQPTCGLDESRQSTPKEEPTEKVRVEELKMAPFATGPAMFRRRSGTAPGARRK